MNIRRLLTLLAVLFLLVISFQGQSTNKEFVSGRARFAIKPSDSIPLRYGSINEEFGIYAVFGDTFVWSDETRQVAVTHLIPWQTKGRSVSISLSPAAKTLILNHYKDIFKADFAMNSATVDESPFVLNGFKGVEFRITGEHRSIVRQFFLGNRFYILIAQLKKRTDLMNKRAFSTPFVGSTTTSTTRQ